MDTQQAPGCVIYILSLTDRTHMARSGQRYETPWSTGTAKAVPLVGVIHADDSDHRVRYGFIIP
jgi:hypothetical protein